jgi:hypothetical protein
MVLVTRTPAGAACLGLGEPDLCRILAPRFNVEDVRRVDPDVRPLGRLLKTLELPVGQPRRDDLRIALERQLAATREVNVARHHCEFSPAAAARGRGREAGWV